MLNERFYSREISWAVNNLYNPWNPFLPRQLMIKNSEIVSNQKLNYI